MYLLRFRLSYYPNRYDIISPINRRKFRLHTYYRAFRTDIQLHGNFDLIVFDCDDAAFVISVAGGSRSAYNFETSPLKLFGQRINRFFASDGKRDVCISRACRRFFGVGDIGLFHYFQPSPFIEAYKIRAEIGRFIVISGAGMSVKIFDKKIFCFLQIIYIHSNVFDFHFCHSLIPQSFLCFYRFPVYYLKCAPRQAGESDAYSDLRQNLKTYKKK